jgi:uncharacterized membrane protein
LVTQRPWASGFARAAELALAISGLGHLLVNSERPASEALFLLCWNAVAVSYLLLGMRYLRRHLEDEDEQAVSVPTPTGLRGQRFSFLFTVAASLTGLGAALDVLQGFEGNLAPALESLSVVTVICAWMLLHLGYARFYEAWDRRRNREGFHFPRTPSPRFADYLYFSITVGVSFAASDVEVCQRTLRWHVLVHSVASFFYNAVVLAVGVGVITGR